VGLFVTVTQGVKNIQSR